MTTKNWNNDFMTKVLEEAAWKELSSEFAWNEQLLGKYKDKVVWKEISDNSNILWTVSMIEKFKNKVDWEELSGSDNGHLFSRPLKYLSPTNSQHINTLFALKYLQVFVSLRQGNRTKIIAD